MENLSKMHSSNIFAAMKDNTYLLKVARPVVTSIYKGLIQMPKSSRKTLSINLRQEVVELNVIYLLKDGGCLAH